MESPFEPLLESYEPAPSRPTWLKWGSILGIVSSVFSIFLLTSGNLQSGLQYVSYLISFGAIFLALREYRTVNNGYLKFGQGVKIAVFIGLVSALIGSIIQQIYIMIDPDVITTVMDGMRQQMLEQNPDLPDEALEMATGMTESMLTKPYYSIPVGLISGAIGGAILGLIASAILKNNPPE
ncbi:MAG: DUF4199 domain-containing protein [Bacteroidota bacterium]